MSRKVSHLRDLTIVALVLVTIGMAYTLGMLHCMTVVIDEQQKQEKFYKASDAPTLHEQTRAATVVHDGQ